MANNKPETPEVETPEVETPEVEEKISNPKEKISNPKEKVVKFCERCMFAGKEMNKGDVLTVTNDQAKGLKARKLIK